jgi:hypothetical protein
LRQLLRFRRVRRDQESDHHSDEEVHSLRTLLSREERMLKQAFSFETKSSKSKKSIKSRRSKQQAKKKKRQRQ